MFAQEFQLFRLSRWLGFLADRNVVKGKFVALGIGAQVFVIGKDAGQLTIHFTGSEAQNTVVKTVVEFGHKERNLGSVKGSGDLNRHAKFIAGKLFKRCRLFIGLLRGRDPLNPLKKDSCFVILMLVGMDDIAAA